MQKYKETSHENTATLYSAIRRSILAICAINVSTKLTMYYVYVKKLLVEDNLISFFRYHHLEATTEISGV